MSRSDSNDVPPAALDAGPGVYEMTPAELDARRRGPAPPTVVDVREPWEYALARLPRARPVPLGALADDPLGTLGAAGVDPARPVVVYCHHGARGRTAVGRLRAAGVTRVTNLAGGIERWSVEVDAGVARY